MPSVVRGSLVEQINMAIGLLDPMERDFAQEIGNQITRYAKLYCPVADPDERGLEYEILTHSKTLAKVVWRKPGTLRDSIKRLRVMKTGSGYRTGAKTDDPIAPYVEWNTRAHIIRPKAHAGEGGGMRRDKSGRFVRAAKALRWVDFNVGGNVIAQIRFAREVFHPGTTGAHFMSRAADTVEGKVPEIAERFIQGWLKKADLA